MAVELDVKLRREFCTACMSVLIIELGFKFFMRVVALEVSFPTTLKSPKSEVYTSGYDDFREWLSDWMRSSAMSFAELV